MADESWIKVLIQSENLDQKWGLGIHLLICYMFSLYSAWKNLIPTQLQKNSLYNSKIRFKRVFYLGRSVFNRYKKDLSVNPKRNFRLKLARRSNFWRFSPLLLVIEKNLLNHIKSERKKYSDKERKKKINWVV